MPVNDDFSLRILVGDTVLPEYKHDGVTYVESSFFTPYSFKQQAEENVNGEVEKQSWPVTPFFIQIENKLGSPSCYFRFYIDGQKVTSKSVPPGTKRLVKGFRDGTLVREFLFSLPRYARSEEDRISEDLSSKVGVIEVESCYASLRTTQLRMRNKKLQYDQANKKDCKKVTSGSYLMSTTKAGRVLGMKSRVRNVDFWDVHSVTSKLSVKYVTAQTLQDMNINVTPIPFPANARAEVSSSLRSRPTILGKRSQKDKFQMPKAKIKTEATDHVTESSDDQVTGSSSGQVTSGDEQSQNESSNLGDHVYLGSSDFIKEETLSSSLDGETIDLTFEGADYHDNDGVIEIID